MLLENGLANLSCKGPNSNYSGFVDLTVSVVITQLCPFSATIIINEWVWLYFSKILFIKRGQAGFGSQAIVWKPVL